mmetsp:Transcript_40373/g.101615  ORF Transcript_40373/g.101615 Transcript_40373/m.101615 type:complete len:440 (+) Transcript_40373:319-1638(+)
MRDKFGKLRGRCNNCTECEEYVYLPDFTGNSCDYCGCKPIQHEIVEEEGGAAEQSSGGEDALTLTPEQEEFIKKALSLGLPPEHIHNILLASMNGEIPDLATISATLDEQAQALLSQAETSGTERSHDSQSEAPSEAPPPPSAGSNGKNPGMTKSTSALVADVESLKEDSLNAAELERDLDTDSETLVHKKKDQIDQGSEAADSENTRVFDEMQDMIPELDDDIMDFANALNQYCDDNVSPVSTPGAKPPEKTQSPSSPKAAAAPSNTAPSPAPAGTAALPPKKPAPVAAPAIAPAPAPAPAQESDAKPAQKAAAPQYIYITKRPPAKQAAKKGADDDDDGLSSIFSMMDKMDRASGSRSADLRMNPTSSGVIMTYNRPNSPSVNLPKSTSVISSQNSNQQGGQYRRGSTSVQVQSGSKTKTKSSLSSLIFGLKKHNKK